MEVSPHPSCDLQKSWTCTRLAFHNPHMSIYTNPLLFFFFKGQEALAFICVAHVSFGTRKIVHSDPACRKPVYILAPIWFYTINFFFQVKTIWWSRRELLVLKSLDELISYPVFYYLWQREGRDIFAKGCEPLSLNAGLLFLSGFFYRFHGRTQKQKQSKTLQLIVRLCFAPAFCCLLSAKPFFLDLKICKLSFFKISAASMLPCVASSPTLIISLFPNRSLFSVWFPSPLCRRITCLNW